MNIRRSLWVAASLIVVSSAVTPLSAESVRCTTTLADLGSDRPARISGDYAVESFYFPLPIRNISPGSSALTLLLRTSSEVAPIGASIEISIFDFPLKQEKLQAGQTQQIVVRLDQLPLALLGSDYLKVSLKTVLKPLRSEDRCAEIAGGRAICRRPSGIQLHYRIRQPICGLAGCGPALGHVEKRLRNRRSGRGRPNCAGSLSQGCFIDFVLAPGNASSPHGRTR
jgi:hypothetical protein